MKQLYYRRLFFEVLAGILLLWLPLVAETVKLTAPDGSMVTIYRDEYGVPHINGETQTAVFFGQGFAAARDRLQQMEFYRRAAEGKLAEWLGLLALEMDQESRRMLYTDEERKTQFENLPLEYQTMIQSYSEGVNTYLDSIAANPEQYLPYEFFLLGTDMERWTVYKSIAVIQFLVRIFGQFGGEELTRLVELQENGREWFDLNRPINDPAAPTTIPDGAAAPSGSWRYSGIKVRPAIVEAINSRKARGKTLAQNLQIPTTFGSFAVQITPAKSNTGNVMLLGAPQMGEPEPSIPSIVHEVELQCPEFHVGGMTVAGVPLVIIGHTEHHSWSFTSGISDNSDVYIDSTADNSYGSYYHQGQWLPFETFQDTLYVLNTPMSFTHYRTIHGPVIGDDLENHQVYSLKMAFWNEELEMVDFVFRNIKATSLEAFEQALSVNPMSFNVFYVDREQQVKFWHAGKYQDRSDGVDPRLPHKGDGSEEWGGFIAFHDLPAAENPSRGYFVNWNNKPVSWWNNGDNIPWVGDHRVSLIDQYVAPLDNFTFDNLKDVPFHIQSHGTYQQAVELSASEIIDANIAPPGQSGFINIAGEESPHFSDQWSLHINWEFKDMLFGETPVGVATTERNPVPLRYTLYQNYPNPFNPETQIRFDLPVNQQVSLQIYNIRGQRVRTLVAKHFQAGSHTVFWNGMDDRNQPAASGIYIYHLTAGLFVQQRKMILLK